MTHPRTLQNVTISLPEEVLQEAKHLAVDHGVSLSRFVAQTLADRVRGARDYRAAALRQRRLLEVGLDLGTHGRITWDRDALRDR